MNCESFERWLDEGMPSSQAAEAEVHAAQCRRCQAALDSARELEGLLATAGVPAKADFTDRVLARVAASDAAREAWGWPALTAGLPWWVQAAAQPAIVLAALVAALVAWRPESLLGFGLAVTEALAARWGQGFGAEVLIRSLLGPDIMAPFADPTFRIGLALGLAPLVIMGSRVVFQWTEHWVAATSRTRLRGAR